MNNISWQAIQKADHALHKFEVQVAPLYGREHISFNVHELTRLGLADTVKLWGPLWCISAFAFEINNHNLMLYFHGTSVFLNRFAVHFSFSVTITVQTTKFQPLTPRQLAASNQTFHIMVLRSLQFFKRFILSICTQKCKHIYSAAML